MGKNVATLGLAGFLAAAPVVGANAQTTTDKAKDDISKTLSHSPQTNTSEKSYVVTEKDFITKEDFADFQKSLEEKANFPTDSIDMISVIDSLTSIEDVGKKLVNFYGKDVVNEKMATIIKRSGGFKKMKEPKNMFLISKESLIKESFKEFVDKYATKEEEQNKIRRVISMICGVLAITVVAGQQMKKESTQKAG